ncbi:MAG TPA: ABC transporter permease [Pseudolabrys sp.]|nr:ABC transporter permease [Pseudolabrys sp.]
MTLSMQHAMQERKKARAPKVLAWFAQRKTRRSIISVLVIVAAWELVGRFVLTNPLFFAPLSAVVEAGIRLWQSGELQKDIIASFSAVAYGMILAIVAGIIIGVLSGASRAFREYTDSFFTALYATPLVAVAPILILWFGIGIASKIAVVFLMAVFPILISTAAGISNTEPTFIEVARSFGATRLQIIRKVMIPAAVPFVITGIRLAIGRAIVGVVVGELFGARAGLGFLIFTSGQTFDVPALFLGVLLLALAGVVLTGAMKWIEARVAGWRHVEMD